MKKLISNLTFWVLTSIATGAILGHIYPEKAVEFKWLGTYFIEIVKLFIYPIIFLTITLGISGMGDLKKVGKVGGKALIYFEVVTTFALVIGIIVAYVIKPGEGVIAQNLSVADVSQYTSKSKTFSWWQFLKDNLTIQVLLFSIVSGIVLSKITHKTRAIGILSIISKYVFKALHFVMFLAPLGAFGGMAFTIGKYGIHTLIPLGKLMLSVYITMGLFIFIVLNLILKYYKLRIWSFLKYIREELLIVLGTSSSEAALPSLMEKLERMGCSKSVVGLVVPAGYSFNLDGTTIYLSMATIFLAQVYGVTLTIEQMLTIIGILMVTSKGAAGVTGSGFVVLASTLSAIKVIPIEGLALLLGVDRFMSEARAITNFIGNGVATLWISRNENELDIKKMNYAFTHISETEDIFKDNFNIKN
ncbi:MAG: cation:dicarboxylase symporter family transporter [Cytophagaceae bacterium]|nr:cation:dicarboxylase symporter family transporter [Cytophagaceae bacterium]MBK9934055.1 cation:dicarboxylase symporter family transporter [Cytophagaceae bacterium]MBL0300512.1 cation:dicarboxylase symporter family transporter [Cytophagaceae bacterium]MBL0327446.1 cation:dicarboxylase symporter family transporter [Cytophagaceae bacterium]